MATRSALVNVMAGAAVRAARGLNRDFGEIANLQASEKGADSFVAAALKRAREVLARELGKARRGYGYVEQGAAPRAGDPEIQAEWLVAPLDGLENYRHGVPAFATVIGARERGAVTAAVIYDPLRDELFWAERGTGGYLNHQRARASVRSRLDTALVAIEDATEGADAATYFAASSVLSGRVAAVRKFGAPALGLAAVAAGRFDASVTLAMPDVVAEVGALLVQESGGIMSDLTAKQDQTAPSLILASNGRLDTALRKCLDQVHRRSPAA